LTERFPKTFRPTLLAIDESRSDRVEIDRRGQSVGRALTASPIVQADIALPRARMCGEALEHEQIRFKGEPGEEAKARGQRRLDGIGPSSGAV
jgi:hypothetical protein